MNKDKHEYFERTMLEESIAGVLSLVRRFISWLDFEYSVLITIIVTVIVVIIILLASLPSEKEQRQAALDTYHECRNTQELSEEACLLLALDLD